MQLSSELLQVSLFWDEAGFCYASEEISSLEKRSVIQWSENPPPLLRISWKCSCPLAKEPRQITAIAGCSPGRCLWRGLEAPERHLLGSECGFFPSLETLGSHSVLCGDDPAALPSAHPILAPLGLGTGTAERGEGTAPPALRKCSEEGVSSACNLVQFGRFTWGYAEAPISIRVCNPQAFCQHVCSPLSQWLGCS